MILATIRFNNLIVSLMMNLRIKKESQVKFQIVTPKMKSTKIIKIKRKKSRLLMEISIKMQLMLKKQQEEVGINQKFKIHQNIKDQPQELETTPLC